MNLRGGLFSEKEIQKMASPERLDLLVSVTKRRGWIALAAIAVLVVELLIWSIFGRLTLTVKGEGILINGGVKDVEAGAVGRVARILVSPGAQVALGQPVAELDTPTPAADLSLKRQRMADLIEAKKRQTGLEATGRQRQEIALTSEFNSLPTRIQSMRESVFTKEQEVSQSRMNLKQGFITEATFNESRDRLRQAMEELAKLELRQKQVPAEIAQLAVSGDRVATDRDLEIQKLQAETKKLETDLETVDGKPHSGKIVRATATGRVLERMIDVANQVTEKTRVMTIEPNDSEMETLIYVPAEDAKKIAVNDLGVPYKQVSARVNPSTVKVEEFGSLVGTVKVVQKFPATPEGMQQVLRNSALVQKLSDKGSPIEVRAQLARSKTPSGYLWSSSKGPAIAIVTGTLCKASFEVERKAPISYVIPTVKKTLGIQ